MERIRVPWIRCKYLIINILGIIEAAGLMELQSVMDGVLVHAWWPFFQGLIDDIHTLRFRRRTVGSRLEIPFLTVDCRGSGGVSQGLNKEPLLREYNSQTGNSCRLAAICCPSRAGYGIILRSTTYVVPLESVVAIT